MITLYRKKNDEKAEKIEQRLQELVLAYRVEELMEEQNGTYVEESGKKIQSEEELEAWFAELEDELNWQRSISGDGCYIHPETGKIC